MKAEILHTKDIYPLSVEVVVPLIIEMLDPKSVVDFGCGVGVWLEGFKRRGVNDLLGIDGAYITQEDLLIPQDNYIPFDLERIHELKLIKHFDVALCLECAEHLDAAIAPSLIKTLCRVAPHVVFSAAIPGQTGMGHKNEQYPGYWQELFAREGFLMFDFFRPLIWKDERVEFWYRQNMYLFSNAPHFFKRSASGWDGSLYIARELLEIYVRALDSVNVEKLIRPEFFAKFKPRGFHYKVLAKLRRLLSRVSAR
jgi:SAM-dependent methyltransferase